MPHDVLFARQPIYDRKNAIFGFELLYRGDLLTPPSDQATRATAEVLVNYCTGLIEDDATLGCPIFLNMDEDFITNGAFLSTGPEDLILEVLETVRPTPAVIQGLITLKRQGYRLALDDFIFEPGSEAFFPLVSIIKIDVLGMEISTIKHQLQEFNFTDKKLLAEKVEDDAMFKACKELGFDLFQGYYLERPSMVEGRNFNSSKLALLNLVAKLSKEDISVEEVSDLIVVDPSLVLQILKIINCPLYPFKREITNLREAVIKLGIVVVKQWAIILSLVAGSEQPSELFRTLLVRAKTCALFAVALKKDNAEDYFIIGLFSGLDSVLGVELTTLLNTVCFSTHIKRQLLSFNQDPESILAMVIASEKGEQLNISLSSKNTLIMLDEAYWEGLMWADELMHFVVSK